MAVTLATVVMDATDVRRVVRNRQDIIKMIKHEVRSFLSAKCEERVDFVRFLPLKNANGCLDFHFRCKMRR